MENLWDNQLYQKLIKQHGSSQGQKIAEKYLLALAKSYKGHYSADDAAFDLMQVDALSLQRPLAISFFELKASNYPLHVKFYQYDWPIPLSDIIPIIENMGLRTDRETPSRIAVSANQFVWINDFNVSYTLSNVFHLKQIKNNFIDALFKINAGICENDGFNKLVLGAGLSWREITIIRAYAKYMQQTGFRFRLQHVEQTMIQYAEITKKLIQLFYTKFDPTPPISSGLTTGSIDGAGSLDPVVKPLEVGAGEFRKNTLSALEDEIKAEIDAITSLDEDYIVRHFLALITATLRTNFFQINQEGEPRECISFKILSSKVPDLPRRQPLYELYVYSTRFEGIYLRNAKVARGSIHCSDRIEDYRQEVLTLMNAQIVENSVIVPSGAKGGFILKKSIDRLDREQVQQEKVYCYQSFIRGLLDLTDNFEEGRVVSPKNTLCYDDADPYLVVAADKGATAFADMANDISKEYNFWLGDAFASGGSSGYDQRQMGISARGTWEAIKRHFRELDTNIEQQDFKVVGIGNMSTDVFGNGLTYTPNALLIAAFDQQHIFLDPNPDRCESFAERQRLFRLPNSSWEDYNHRLISKGGGVYKRSEPSITITPEVSKIISINKASLTPNELIQAILKAPVDLLFNGGDGTYVKASTESNADVGDKTNELCRINANDLRCKIVGEGGNRGVTQPGRIEFALKGGLINTDAIDNSAGVNCFDHEVNIKILLNKEMSQGKLTEKKRNQLLAQISEEVAQLVLKDNYKQAQILSLSFMNPHSYSKLYLAYIKELERSVNLNRTMECIPTKNALLERKVAGQLLTRPELAIILAYTKIYISNEFLKSDLPDNPYFSSILEDSFPAILAKSYAQSIQTHSLRREIIATQLSNLIVNNMGITFMYRLQIETGQSVADIAKAYVIAAKAYQIDELHQLIDSLNHKVSVKTQYELLHYVRQLMNLATGWFLQHGRFEGEINHNIANYRKCIHKIEKIVPDLMAGVTKEYLNKMIIQFAGIGLPEEAAKKIAATRAMYTVLNAIEVATQNKFDLKRTVEVYFKIGNKLRLVWFRDHIANDYSEGHWNNMARLSLRDILDSLQRELTTIIILAYPKERNSEKLIDAWFAKNPFLQQRWQKLFEMMLGNSSNDYTIFFIAFLELSRLIRSAS